MNNLIWYLGFAGYLILLWIMNYKDGSVVRVLFDEKDDGAGDILWLIYEIVMAFLWPISFIVVLVLTVWEKHKSNEKRKEREKKIDLLIESKDKGD